jgi:hypothetical protein
MSLRSFASVVAALAALGVASAASAAVTFVGPDGWHHVDQPSTDSVHKFDQWKISGTAQSLTVIQDSSTTYADSLGAVKANFAAQHINPALDKDEPCMGRPSHVVEYTVGPEGHQIIVNRLIVPDGSGVVTVTYARAHDDAFDADVKKAITNFCAQAG